jgi:CheY-like chemotaxis protein
MPRTDDPATRDLPILMLTSVTQQTGLLMDPKRDEGFLPVNEFIEKPVSPRALLDLVRKHVGK